eukprot:COSAG02_NODE_2638_length_8353_cov_13.889145_8_plen_103_part_00
MRISILPFLCALLSIFQSPGVISGEVDAMSSSLSAFACASFGASMIASAEFPYLPIVSTTDITYPSTAATRQEKRIRGKDTDRSNTAPAPPKNAPTLRSNGP